MKKNILQIGPSITRSKGGMATVLDGIKNNKLLNSNHNINFHDSYIDGNIIKRLIFSVIAYIKFKTIYSKYDIFHIHMASYGSVFRKGYYIKFLNKKNKKIILHVHGGAYLKFYEGLSENKKRKVREIWDKCDCVIVLSEVWKRNFENIFNHKNIVVVNNGIDIKQYEEGKSIDKKDNFLFLGKIVKAKGVYDLVSAIEQIIEKYPNILVYMAGEGETNQLEQIINKKNLNNNIKLVGWIDFETKLKLLKDVSTVILPSYNEGLPMALLEGMASGKVVIGTNVGGIPELIEEGINGFVIEPGDINELSKSIIKIIDDNELVEKISQNNIKKIKKAFSGKKMYETIDKLYNEY